MTSPPIGPSSELSAALRRARLTEAAHLEAVLDIRDAKTLRLQVLKDEIAPVLAGFAEAQQAFDLALVPGDPPRLWIDLVTFVVMEPEPQVYRLVQDVQDGRMTLLETSDRTEMAAQIKEHIAHRLVARARRMVAPAGVRYPLQHPTAALLIAWILGLAMGAMALFIALILLEKGFW